MDIDFLTTSSTDEQIANPNIVVCRQPDKKILCGSSTLARGLCVGTEPECYIRTFENRTIPGKVESETSETSETSYAYTRENIGKGCYLNFDELIIDYEKSYPESEVDLIPDNFKLLTYNIWGLAVEEKHLTLFDLRKDLLIKTLEESDADIFCLQEMSEYAYSKLTTWIHRYKFASETPYPATRKDRKRDVDTYIVSKYRPKRVVTYALPGILSHYNSLSLIEYPNLVIFNIYSQAGGIFSPGQENYWIHYSRCRFDLFNMIYDKIKTSYIDQNVIICGDFNCDLDGQIPIQGLTKNVWPELEMINKFKEIGFIDTFRNLHPDPKVGLTEDTNLNVMRWNQKFKEKMYRYDAIFYKSILDSSESYQIASSEIIGTDRVYLSEADSEWFIDTISEKKELGDFRGLRFNENKRPLIPINPSDHFGVITNFIKHISQSGGNIKNNYKNNVKNNGRKIRYVLRKKH
jgi:exonuclease III